MKQKPRILIIDDEDDYRAMLLYRLSYEGFEVIEARNGSIGIDKINECQPDLILLDIMMPVMSGHKVWSDLKKDATLASIPVLILTSKSRIQDHFWRDALPDGDYISKTTDFSKIIAKIFDKLARKDTEQRQFSDNL